MITLIHGEDITASRNSLGRNADGFSGEVIRVDGKSATAELLTQAVMSQSLLNSSKLVVVESLSENKTLFSKLPPLDSKDDILFWENKQLTPGQIKTFQAAFQALKIQNFPISSGAFKFVESLAPKPQKTTLKLFQDYNQQEISEIIFTMIVRQFRLLILATNSSGADEFVKLAPWQQEKLKSQAKLFTNDQLKDAYRKLLKIDYEVKNGLSLSDLTGSLELFLLEL